MARPPLGRQQLLDSAREEIILGNGSLQVAALCRRTGLSSGALYHHFGSKAGLMVAVFDDFYEGLRATIADEHLPHGDWAEREQVRTRRFVEYHFADPLAVVLLDRVAPDADVAAREAQYLHALIEGAARNIARGQRDGDLDAALDAGSVGAYLIGGLRHGIAQQLRCTPRPDVGTATARLWDLVAATTGVA
jgi:AcrR family transcriptional regulator